MKPHILIGYSACPLTLEAFERAGCEAWTCDLLPSRGRPDRHLQCDIWEVADGPWDAAIFHPMCTYLTVSAAWAFGDGPYHQQVKPGTLVGEARRQARDEAILNFKRLEELPYPTAIENPAPSFVSKTHRPPDQTIQPYHSGTTPASAQGFGCEDFRAFVPQAMSPAASSTARSAGQIRPTAGKTGFRRATAAGLSAARPTQELPMLSGASGAPI